MNSGLGKEGECQNKQGDTPPNLWQDSWWMQKELLSAQSENFFGNAVVTPLLSMKIELGAPAWQAEIVGDQL